MAKLLFYVEDLPTSITRKARVYQSKLYYFHVKGVNCNQLFVYSGIVVDVVGFSLTTSIPKIFLYATCTCAVTNQ